MYLTIELSEPIFPELGAQTTNIKPLVSKLQGITRAPGARDAIEEYNETISYIVRQVALEYSKNFSEEEKAKQSNNNLSKTITNQATILSSK